jgi:XTP/dITP diphosphohydrolase
VLTGEGILPRLLLQTPPERAAPEEDALENFDSFEENAAAKALYFARLTGQTALADDSGLCVDALGGAPGVRSKRFAQDHGVAAAPDDAANNALLLRLLQGVPSAQRGARYVCAIAVATPRGLVGVEVGSCDGFILTAPEGKAGFGYDPLFYVPEERATFGAISAARKNLLSHRACAMRSVFPLLLSHLGERAPVKVERASPA